MLLKLFTYLIIPIYTILLALQDDLFDSNLSVIGGYLKHRDGFMLWGFMIIAYFYLVLTKIIENYKLKHEKLNRSLVIIASILLLISLAIPYIPSQSLLKASLHVIFAFTSTVCLFLVFLLITWELRKRDKKAYGDYFIYIIAISILSAVLILLVGIISGFLEIFITITTTLLAYSLLNKSKNQLSDSKKELSETKK